jgi:hypothetical protein
MRMTAGTLRSMKVIWHPRERETWLYVPSFGTLPQNDPPSPNDISEISPEN